MPKASKTTASIRQEIPGAVSLSENFPGGWTVNFESETADVDTTEVNKSMPGGTCPTRHLGYVIKGEITYRTANGDETFVTGDAYLVEPGHTSLVKAGTEYIEFSPTEQQTETYAKTVAYWSDIAVAELKYGVQAPFGS